MFEFELGKEHWQRPWWGGEYYSEVMKGVPSADEVWICLRAEDIYFHRQVLVQVIRITQNLKSDDKNLFPLLFPPEITRRIFGTRSHLAIEDSHHS